MRERREDTGVKVEKGERRERREDTEERDRGGRKKEQEGRREIPELVEGCQKVQKF